MFFPEYRARRTRRTDTLRRMVRENFLRLEDLIYPMFSAFGENIKKEIPSMPGIYQQSIEHIAAEAKEVYELGIPAVILFGIPETKDPLGQDAYSPDGIIQRTVRAIKQEVPELLVITDVCMCEYTDHGHCGVIKNGDVDNDETLKLLAAEALSHARAGADIIAPSDMMDGRVAAIREILDANDFSNIPIMSYSVKYSSAYYGPFRDAADSTPQFGDRRSYQMDPPNRIEALREAELDVQECADFLMVKPALAYLDILRDLKEHFNLPLVAYNVSGEYSMVKAAAERGWIDGDRVMMETLVGMKRAGADLIITYHAKEAARLLRG
ncbi:MAG: porphobilinogen synthase [Desulfuromonadales bacterium]|nr:porphobilinogen synthase [Desulfuromonadales bacterium]